MNPLLAAPHRRDAFIGSPDPDYLIRLYAMEQHDGAIKLVQWRIARVMGGEDEAPRRPMFLRATPPDAQNRLTFDPDEAAYLATGSVRWDGVTTIGVEVVVDSKESLWQLLAAIEQARRECAIEMGSAYMDRFEYGKEKRRG